MQVAVKREERDDVGGQTAAIVTYSTIQMQKPSEGNQSREFATAGEFFPFAYLAGEEALRIPADVHLTWNIKYEVLS
ncbi:hypothetical protein D5086_030203 [Populus alba]|uniref:Uncharacterized protein n=1 Tax=Populus alba TaxID=43335 RepID=A0ACC4AMU9_POPAL